MKYIKKYKTINEKKWDIEYHLYEILDIFRDYADEYDLRFEEDLNSLNLELNCYSIEYPSKSSWGASLVIIFDDYFGSAGVGGDLGEDFQMDMREFIKRLEKIGFECEIDWDGGQVYGIEIYSK